MSEARAQSRKKRNSWASFAHTVQNLVFYGKVGNRSARAIAIRSNLSSRGRFSSLEMRSISKKWHFSSEACISFVSKYEGH